MEKIYHDKTECSGCGLCVSVCSRTAISMKKDCYGFFYPQIEQSKCIDCGQCKQSCAFGEATMFAVKTSYAAVNKNREQLMSSASGGIFSAVAEAFLKDGGVVCGAHMTFNNGYAKVEHEVIESPDKLYQLQGSKYIQSNIQVAFRDVLSYLKQGKAVLFSGTPCQVAAMRKYVPLRYEESLFTMDIICHGVPSQKYLMIIFNMYQRKRK